MVLHALLLALGARPGSPLARGQGRSASGRPADTRRRAAVSAGARPPARRAAARALASVSARSRPRGLLVEWRAHAAITGAMKPSARRRASARATPTDAEPRRPT